MRTTGDNELAVGMVNEIAEYLYHTHQEKCDRDQSLILKAIEVAKYRELEEINKKLERIAEAIESVVDTIAESVITKQGR